MTRLAFRRRRGNGSRVREAVFVGYPKTGNTWSRFLLGRFMQLRCGLDEMPLFDGVKRSGRGERGCVGPGMYFTHDPLRWETQVAADLNAANTVMPFDGRHVVLLVRYPLDVLVSSWHQAVRQERTFSGSLDEFIADPVHGLEKLVRFYDLWRANAPEALRLLRYEDLRADTEEQLMGLLGYLGIEPDRELVERAVADSTFDAMRRLEAEGRGPKFASSGLDVFATGDRDDPNAFHVRRGEVGGYRDELDPAACHRLEEAVSSAMGGLYGYDPPPES